MTITRADQPGRLRTILNLLLSLGLLGLGLPGLVTARPGRHILVIKHTLPGGSARLRIQASLLLQRCWGVASVTVEVGGGNFSPARTPNQPQKPVSSQLAYARDPDMPIASLLRPPRPRLREALQRASEGATSREIWEAMWKVGGRRRFASWEADQGCPGAGPLARVLCGERGCPGCDPDVVVWTSVERPATLRATVDLVADPEGVVQAEALAFAVGAALERRGAPRPRQVVWRHLQPALVREQRRRAIEHRAGRSREHGEPEERGEHLPVGIEDALLDRKLRRDLRALQSQALAVALVMACGLAMMITTRSQTCSTSGRMCVLSTTV